MTKLGYFNGESTQNNVSQFLETVAKEKPKQIVLNWVDAADFAKWDKNLSTPLPHKQIEISTFIKLIRQCAFGLTQLGFQKGDRVILFLPMSVGLYVAMSALQRIGAIPVFLDSWARRSHLGVSAQVVSPKGMISFEKAFDLVKDVPELNNLPLKVVAGPHQQKYNGVLEQLMHSNQEAPVTPVMMEHTALITFTTGSSGTPKGANRTHRFLAAQHYALDHSVPYMDQDIDMPAFPIFSLNNIASGINTVIPAFDIGVPNEIDPIVMLAQFKACNVNCTTLSPSLLNRLSSYCLTNNLQLPTMRRMLTGGAPISRDNLVDIKKVAANSEVWVLYGSTEAEPMAHIEATEMIDFKSKGSTQVDYVDQGVNVGHMAEGLDYKFIKIIKSNIEVKANSDWDKIEVPKGDVGELIVAGEHVCAGYYNNEEAFFKSKIRGLDGKIWHRTGDLGFLDDNKYLWIVGRIHNAIERAGKYYFPVRAEVILKRIEHAKYVAYLGVPDPQLGEKCVACLSFEKMPSEEQKNHIIAEVKRLFTINDQIPADKILILESIPMDPRHHSKVEYDILREQLKKDGLV